MRRIFAFGESSHSKYQKQHGREKVIHLQPDRAIKGKENALALDLG